MVCEICGSKHVQQKKENGKYYWECDCDYVVNEESMIEFISRSLWLDDRTPQNTIQFIENKVEKIKVKSAVDFMVLIKGQDPMLWRPPHWHY